MFYNLTVPPSFGSNSFIRKRQGFSEQESQNPQSPMTILYQIGYLAVKENLWIITSAGIFD